MINIRRIEKQIDSRDVSTKILSVFSIALLYRLYKIKDSGYSVWNYFEMSQTKKWAIQRCTLYTKIRRRRVNKITLLLLDQQMSLCQVSYTYISASKYRNTIRVTHYSTFVKFIQTGFFFYVKIIYIHRRWDTGVRRIIVKEG